MTNAMTILSTASSSVLPESPRWLISKGRFTDAEKVLRQIATTNKTTFDPVAYERLKEEQEKVGLVLVHASLEFLVRSQNMSNKQNQDGIMSLFRSKIMLFISINLFFQW